MTRKKTLVAVLAGVFVMAGILVPYVTQASGHGHKGFPMGRGPGIMAGQMAEELGISKEEVGKYCRQGVNPRELSHAAAVAKASGKSFNEVLAMKTLANTWQDVEQAVGVTREQLQAQRQDAMATKLESKLAIPKQDTLELLRQGYHTKDIVTAAALAKESQKPVADVLAMKKINNRWHDVARELGLSDEAFKQSMGKIHEAMGQGHPGHGGHQGPMGPQGREPGFPDHN